MPAPTITFYDVTSNNNGGNQQDQIRFFKSGGADGNQLMPSPLDFGPTEAGFWSRPKVFLIESSGDTVKNLGFRLWDTQGSSDPQNNIVTNLGENVIPNPFDHNSTSNWQFKFMVKNSWVDPTTISIDPSNSEISGWLDLAWASEPSSVLDTVFQNYLGSNGNNGQQKLLVQHAYNGNYYTNFFIYLACRPKQAATAGVHEEWGFRLSYIYPGDPV